MEEGRQDNGKTTMVKRQTIMCLTSMSFSGNLVIIETPLHQGYHFNKVLQT